MLGPVGAVAIPYLAAGLGFLVAGWCHLMVGPAWRAPLSGSARASLGFLRQPLMRGLQGGFAVVQGLF